MLSTEELNYDIKKWLMDLAEAREVLISLTKNNPNGFINDIGALLKSSIRLKNCILTQEKKMKCSFRESSLEGVNSLFQNHKKIRIEMESLRFKVFNLKLIMNKIQERRSSISI
jgi:hypothetical protein